jgi:hypothetical protein
VSDLKVDPGLAERDEHPEEEVAEREEREVWSSAADLPLISKNRPPVLLLHVTI